MEDDYEQVVNRLEAIEHDVARLLSELRSASPDQMRRANAVLRAARYIRNMQMAGPTPLAPTPSGSGGSTAGSASLTCPHCGGAVSLALV